MRTNRTGYLMAMLAGLAIVGASTGGVIAATSHHAVTLAAEQSQAAAALDSSAAVSVPSSGPLAASSAPVSVAAAAPSVATIPPTTPARSATPTKPAAASSLSSPRPARGSSPATPGTPVPATTSSKAPAAAAVALKYKNGQYTATGSYNCPSGTEKLGVTITLASDKVISSNLDLLGGAGLSHSFQASFQSGYAPQVIGKDIDSVSVGAVSGSSLTSTGFNDALKQIESQAKT